jgi:putative ABC transport system substrate-binding protein
LARLAPEVIFTLTGAATRAVQRETKRIPIVFQGGGGDPPVANIARPEGNTTGFAGANNSIGGKWVELLREVAPNVAKVAYIFNPSTRTPDGGGYLPSVEEAARALAIKVIALPAHNADETERGIVAFAAEPNGGLIVGPLATDRELIFRLAAEPRLPVASSTKLDVAAGSLFAYLYDRLEIAPRVAFYVDRILRGEKVSNLPVQFPTKFELVINLKTAKALGLTIPPALLARADQVIE